MNARFLLVACTILASQPSAAEILTGRVTLRGKPVANAVVYLTGGTAGQPQPQRAVMDQRNLSFVPPVLPVVRGTTVEFTNNDDIQHNVFSPSAVANQFDLGTYGPGAARSITFDKAGEAVILCNIHMEMEAHIVVLDQPYFALTNAAGDYRIANAPTGRYQLKIWRHKFLPQSRDVEVGASDARVDLELQE